MKRFCALLMILGTVGGRAPAGNWPQWRGPFLNGSADETGLPESWDTASNVVWKAALPGPGGSTPAVWGRRVFLTSLGGPADGNKPWERVVALCLDAETGAVQWERTLGPDRVSNGQHAASPSPVTDGRSVWFMSGTGRLAAFDLEGRELWSRELEADVGRLSVKFGFHASPLLLDGRLYLAILRNVNPLRYGGETDDEGPADSFLLALDAATGSNVWRQVRGTDAVDESAEGYITPMPLTVGVETQLVVPGGEFVTGHDVRTGEECWRWEFTPRDRQVWQRVVTSCVIGDGLVYAQRPKHRPLFALRAGARGVVGDEIVAWRFEGPTPDSNTPLLYRGRLYVVDCDRRIASCLDAATGASKWQAPLGFKSPVRASPTGADGKVYLISEGGEVLVIDAGDAFHERWRTEMGGKRVHSTIVAALGSLFLRTADALYRIGSAAR